MKNNESSFKRLVKKSGGLNFKVVNVEDKGERYIGDFFTTLGKNSHHEVCMYAYFFS